MKTADWANRIDTPTGAAAYLCAFTLIVVACAAMLAPVFDYVVSRPGGANNIPIILAALGVMALWMRLMMLGKWLHVLGLQILLLNVTARATELFGVVEFTDYNGRPEIASATTLLIVLAGVGLMAQQFAAGRRGEQLEGRAAETALVMFCVFGVLVTASQLVNHTPWSAFWLSVTAAWQYALVGILTLVAIRRTEDLAVLWRYMVCAVLLSIVIRMATRGEVYMAHEGLNPLRLGSIAFGPANYYSSTVAVVITLGLGLLGTARTGWGKAVCGVVLLVLAVEQVSTFTRGGYVALTALAMLPLFKGTRRFAAGLAIFAGLTLLAVGRWVLPILFLRSFSLDEPSVQQRFWLIRMGIGHCFDNFGFGHGIARYILFEDPIGTGGEPLPLHSLLLQTAQMAGGLATLALIGLFAWIGVRLWKVARSDRGPLGRSAAFVLIAVVGWHVYSNTTGTSILCYAPQEATVLVWVLMFMGVRLIDLGAERKASAPAGSVLTRVAA
jgi:hypothetical protein